jgi:hypothetical protein
MLLVLQQVNGVAQITDSFGECVYWNVRGVQQGDANPPVSECSLFL